jgi:multiple sugar transport system substrate-binding protein
MKLLVICLLLFYPWLSAAEGLRVLYMVQAGYTPRAVEERTEQFSAATGQAVSLQFEEYEALYELLVSGSDDFDVVLLDNIWTADFVNRGLLEPLPAAINAYVSTQTIPAIYNANSYSGQLWAVPFLANFQLLYTNMTLLRQAGFDHPPRTLSELYQMATRAKALGLMEYPWFDSFRAEEVLVCELVWLSGLDAHDWQNRQGRFLVDRPELRKAVQFVLDAKNSGILNPFSLQSGETFAAEVFVWGDALFTTNWTFVIGEYERAATQIVRPRPFELGVSLLPTPGTGGPSKTISVFQGLAVMSASRKKNLAWEYIMYLSSPDFQRQHLEEFPVWTKLWQEPEILESDFFFTVKRQQVAGAISRPVHPRYSEISKTIQHWVHAALSGRLSVDEAFRSMQTELDRMGL